MSAYRVYIDGRVYEGTYRNAANAVFGAMRKDENAMRSEYGHAEARSILGNAPGGKVLIGVEILVSTKPKHIHRVEAT